MTSARAGYVVGGRYRLVAELGSGGFGRVWEAHDETLDIAVAIKELRLLPGMSPAEQDERLARATREARNAARLRNHENIVAIHDVLVEDGLPWIVMELIDGGSLAEHLETGGPLTVEAAADVAKALLTAIEAAHREGVVHRDIKPANVMLAHSGKVLLTDFGTAVRESDTTLTASGLVIGSPEYLAPERLRGIDDLPASDLYSLGMTLYQALEGVSPFRRSTPVATLSAVLLEEVPAPQRAGRLTPLLTRLLDKDPATRPTIAEALALAGTPAGPQQTKALTKLVPKEPESAVGKPMRDRVGLLATALVAFVVVLYLAVHWTHPSAGDSGTTGTSTSTEETTTTDETTAEETTEETTDDTTETTDTTETSSEEDTWDSEDTDETPFTEGALLPEQFTDDDGVTYARVAGGAKPCDEAANGQGPESSASVVAELTSRGCDQVMTGVYLEQDSEGTASDAIHVSIQVFAFADSATASDTRDYLDGGVRWNLSTWCTPTGIGSKPCQDNGNRGYRVETNLADHRYVIAAVAAPTDLDDLSDESALRARLDPAVNAGAASAGPENY